MKEKDIDYYMGMNKVALAHKCMRMQNQLSKLSEVYDVSDVCRMIHENQTMNRQLSYIDDTKDLIKNKLDELGIKHRQRDSLKNYVQLLLDSIK